MLDTVVFILKNCNQRKSRKSYETEEQHREQPYAFHGNHLMYLALEEKEHRYIERTHNVTHLEVAENKTAIDLLGKREVKRSWVRSPKVLMISKDKETLFTKNTRGKVTIASSNYNIVYDIKSNQQDIEFQLSIPKYMYAHSVAQFIPNPNSKRFMQKPALMGSPVHQANNAIERLVEFIRVFFKDLSLSFGFSLDIEMLNIEIKKIDLCYNQLFNSKAQALSMLEGQKKIYMKRIRKNSPTHKDEKTSIYYRNSKRTFFLKIYHKGSEFNKQNDRDKKSDFKRLMNFNEEFYGEMLNDKNENKDFVNELEFLNNKHFPNSKESTSYFLFIRCLLQNMKIYLLLEILKN